MGEIILQGFNADDLNQRIQRKKDRIVYQQIVVDTSNPRTGIQHIRERHLDDIVNIYCTLHLSDKTTDHLGKYSEELQMPDSFKKYYESVCSIAVGLDEIAKSHINPIVHNKFRMAVYNGRLADAKDHFNPRPANQTKAAFDKRLQELYDTLTEARKLLSKEQLDKIDASIIAILSKVAQDPQAIWKEADSHIYISRFRIKNEERFVMFVASDDGNLYTAYIKNPIYDTTRHQVIYSKGREK